MVLRSSADLHSHLLSLSSLLSSPLPSSLSSLPFCPFFPPCQWLTWLIFWRIATNFGILDGFPEKYKIVRMDAYLLFLSLWPVFQPMKMKVKVFVSGTDLCYLMAVVMKNRHLIKLHETIMDLYLWNQIHYDIHICILHKYYLIFLSIFIYLVIWIISSCIFMCIGLYTDSYILFIVPQIYCLFLCWVQKAICIDLLVFRPYILCSVTFIRSSFQSQEQSLVDWNIIWIPVSLIN